ncbi:MAG: hypothetical protein E7218_07245 [Anaerofustis stercorihominis]|nr:hypothetical protein [Anaerofustis stercorihominis]
MTFKMGFTPDTPDEINENTYTEPVETPKQSVVNVYFEKKNVTYAYYNDLFDLSVGDIVFVEGKLEGIQGKVVAVNYNFKIDLSKFKKVVSVADTAVKGDFFLGGSHFVTFDKDAIPAEKADGWFIPEPKEKPEIIEGYDDSEFHIGSMSEIVASEEDMKHAQDYFMQNMVRYVRMDDDKVYAIVEGSKAYSVEFEYRGGMVSRLVGSCFCGYSGCRHKMGALLQFYDTLTRVETFYHEKLEQSNYFAAIARESLFEMTFNRKAEGSFTMDM